MIKFVIEIKDQEELQFECFADSEELTNAFSLIIATNPMIRKVIKKALRIKPVVATTFYGNSYFKKKASKKLGRPKKVIKPAKKKKKKYAKR